MFKIETSRIARSFMDHSLNEGEVIRMNPLENHFQVGLQRPCISKDRKSFGGPAQLAAGNVPAETARATQSLGFSQVSLTSSQCVFISRTFNRNAGQMSEA